MKEPLKNKIWYGTINVHKVVYDDLGVKSDKKPMLKLSLIHI